ncbi:hypothetical protein DMZ43_06205 [Meridianimaribacter sp. CL38]|uniref:hypothetical protein n=1 Tax=Meridianimaribacter sp. CL38 TaxID=2213021 RepID=UPI00103A76DC|nr:hypothetical protein [Meridianimaribacter sp. CL38]TBV26654.1 hypothetical protein DMZ43_06205 [Meridianimaribacter sp. CL38]
MFKRIPPTIKSKLFLLGLVVFFNLSVGAQTQFKIDNSGINGFYSAIIDGKNFERPRLTQIYIYEYRKTNTGSRFFCKVIQYQGKRASGKYKASYFVGSTEVYSKNIDVRSLFTLHKIGNHQFNIKGIDIISDTSVSIIGNETNSYNTITGTYKRHPVSTADFDDFLNVSYTKLLEKYRVYGQANDEIIWGTKTANSGQRYNSVKKSGIELTSKLINVIELYNASTIEMISDYDGQLQYTSKTDDEQNMLSSALNHKRGTNMEPLAYFFPNLNKIHVRDGKSKALLYKLNVKHESYGLSFDINNTNEAIALKDKEITAIEAKKAKELELKKAREQEQERIYKEYKEKQQAKELAWQQALLVSKEKQKAYKKENNNIVTFEDSFWWNTFGTTDEAKQLMSVFEGHFDLIPYKSKSWVLWEYILYKSNKCSSSISDAKTVSVKVTEFQAMSQIENDGRGYISYYQDILVDGQLHNYFLINLRYHVVNYSEMTQLITLLYKFNAKFGCNSKEAKQLYTNMTKMALNKPALQMQ